MAAAHSATADEGGVHRGAHAVSGRGNVRFTEHDPSTQHVQVDMDDVYDVAGAHMHEKVTVSEQGREASFGGSLRTPLVRVSQQQKGTGGSESATHADGEADVNQPLLS